MAAAPPEDTGEAGAAGTDSESGGGGMSAGLTAAALAAAGIFIVQGGRAIGRGIEASSLDPGHEEHRELTLLKYDEENDLDALTTTQKQDIQQQFTAEQGAAAREAQAAQLSAAAARGGAVATAGRELFIAEQVQQAEVQKRHQREASVLATAETEARESRRRRIEYLQARRDRYLAAKKGATSAAIGVPFEAAGGAMTSYASASLTGDLPVEEPPVDTDNVGNYASGI